MKTNTVRLQRWLDRLTAACSNSKWKSAVAEADCLSAELKQMREELWQQAECQKQEPALLRFKNCAAFSGKSLGIAMIIICMCAFPVAIESGGSMTASVPTGAESKFEELALVTTEEKELLQMLRTNLNDKNITVRAAQVPAPSAGGTKKTVPVKTAQAVPAPKPQTAAVPAVNPADQKKTIKAEDLLTLIKIGEKSLRGSDSAIKIIN